MSTEAPSFFSSLFFSVRSTASAKFVRAPVDVVLKVLHDPTAVIKLDPLVHTCTRSTTQTGLWNVVDRIKLLNWWNVSVRYTASFQSAPNGVTIDVKANRLLTMRNTWKVRGTKEGTEVFMEVQSRVSSGSNGRHGAGPLPCTDRALYMIQPKLMHFCDYLGFRAPHAFPERFDPKEPRHNA